MEIHQIINSSQIIQIGYDNKINKLRVWFGNGGSYDYYEVPENVWNAFKDSKSKGSFFGSTIKGVYEYKKV